MTDFDFTVRKAVSKTASQLSVSMAQPFRSFRAEFNHGGTNVIPAYMNAGSSTAFLKYVEVDTENTLRVGFRNTPANTGDAETIATLQADLLPSLNIELISGATNVSWRPWVAEILINDSRGEYVITDALIAPLVATMDSGNQLTVRMNYEPPEITSSDDPARVHDLEIFQQHLCLASEGSIFLSVLGQPHNFTDATEIGIGRPISGMLSGYRDTLFIFSPNQTATLVGTSAADWRYAVFDAEAGALANTIQQIEQPTAMDDRGILTIQAVEAFGDFGLGRVSEPILRVFQDASARGAIPLASVRLREKNQYRIFLNDGTIITMTLIPNPQGGYFRNYSLSRFDILTRDSDNVVTNVQTRIVREVAVGETEGTEIGEPPGREKAFFALDDEDSGFVYEMDKGRSFDGDSINAMFQLGFHDMRAPSHLKLFRKIQIDCDSRDVSHLRIAADFDDGDTHSERVSEDHGIDAFPEYQLTGALDRESTQRNWSSFQRSGKAGIAESRVSGRGRNIAPLIYSSGDDIAPHIVSGVTVLFTLGALLR